MSDFKERTCETCENNGCALSSIGRGEFGTCLRDVEHRPLWKPAAWFVEIKKLRRIIRVKLVQTNYYAETISELDDENDRLKPFEKWVRENVEPSEYEGFIHCPSTTFRDLAMWNMLKERIDDEHARFGELPQCPGCEKRGSGKDHHTCSASSCVRPRMEPAPRPDVPCPVCGHVFTGSGRQHSIYGGCWAHDCNCKNGILVKDDPAPATPSTTRLTREDAEGHIGSKLRDDPNNTTSTMRRDGTVNNPRLKTGAFPVSSRESPGFTRPSR